MRGGFVPGDVAIATVKGRENVRVVAGWSRYDPQLRWCELSPRWAEGDDDECWYFPTDVADPRPLVVIDPEDREQVERLRNATRNFLVEQDGELTSWVDLANAMQAALRSLIAVKPEEPLGLGAVVEDAGGELWIRVQTTNAAPWMRADAGARGIERPYRYYEAIAAVKVLSEGIS